MGISEKEMLKTFNWCRFCLITNPKILNQLINTLKKFKPYIIGRIIKNSKKLNIVEKYPGKKYRSFISGRGSNLKSN